MKAHSILEYDMHGDYATAANAGNHSAGEEKLVLRLYITRGATNSAAAVSNLRDICEDHYLGRCRLEIVDILQDPRRAFADGILLTPTLVKLAPPPQIRIIGDLRQTERVLQALGALDQG